MPQRHYVTVVYVIHSLGSALCLRVMCMGANVCAVNTTATGETDMRDADEMRIDGSILHRGHSMGAGPAGIV